MPLPRFTKYLLVAVLSFVGGHLSAQEITGFGSGDTNPFNTSTDFLSPWTGTTNATSMTVTGVSNNGGGIFQTLATPVAVTNTANLTLTGALLNTPTIQNFQITIFDSSFNSLVYEFTWSSFNSTGKTVTGVFNSSLSTGHFNGTVSSWELDVGGTSGDTVSFTFSDLSFTSSGSGGPAAQTITFPTIPNQVVGAAPFTLGATASSGLSVFYSLVSGPATLSGTNNNTVTVTGVGTVKIMASQAGNGSFAAAPSKTNSFTVTPGAATVSLSNLMKSFNGAAQSPTVTTNPANLAFKITYAGKTVVPSAPGSYAIVATVTDPNYTGTAKGTFVINKDPATVTLGSNSYFYNGKAQAATATTTPAGLAVTFTYNGKATVPVNVGSYAVVATISNPDYSGTASGTETISLAPLSVALGASSAEITQGVIPNGVATTVYFQYGTTTGYGSTTTMQKLGTGKVPVNVFGLITGLQGGTLYHYRQVTVTGTGASAVTTFGPDETLTTLGFETALVAEKGMAATGLSTTFSTFGAPAVDGDNTVAFLSTLTLATGVNPVTTANDVGIFTIDDHSVQTLIARIGSAAAGTGGNFLTLGDPVFNDNGKVAFRATLKPLAGQVTTANATGIWSNSSGSLALVARQGSAAPGTPGNFSTFTSMGLSDTAGVVILATITGTGVTTANNIGIWEGNTSGDLALVLRLGQVVDSKTITKLAFMPTETYVNGQTRGFNAGGDIVAGATFSDKSTGIVRVVGGEPHVFLQKGNGVSALSGAVYATFGAPIINSLGHTAFAATLVSNLGSVTATTNAAIFTDNGINQPLVAQIGTVNAPGIAAPFATFSDPVLNDNEAVAFRATVKAVAGVSTAANATGIWATNGTSSIPALVAREAVTQAPGCPAGATFATFTELALPDQGGANNHGGVVFLATLTANASAGVTSANNTGIWAVDNSGTLQLIARTGDSVTANGTTKVITSIAFLPKPATVSVAGQTRSFEGAGDLVYQATFTDKSTAILNVVFP